MEKIESFEDIIIEQGGTIVPCNLSKEFLEEFEEYMKKSIQESRFNAAMAKESAKHIYIW